MKTGAHLRIQNFGSNVLGVQLEGNPRKPEPDEFRVAFPGGDVSVVRCTDGTYWAHVRVDHEQASMFNPSEDVPHRIIDARLDIAGRHTSEVDTGEFGNDGLYHLAVRVARKNTARACGRCGAEITGALRYSSGGAPMCSQACASALKGKSHV